MPVKKQTLSLLWASSCGICAFPECEQELVCSETKDIIGHICHIVAQKPTGPRGNNSYTYEEINHIDNLILLCPTHHRIVDTDTEKYSIECLKDMKAKHISNMKTLLHTGMPWKLNISQFYYLKSARYWLSVIF
jgi:hypothetical protein